MYKLCDETLEANWKTGDERFKENNTNPLNVGCRFMIYHSHNWFRALKKVFGCGHWHADGTRQDRNADGKLRTNILLAFKQSSEP